MTDKRYIWHAEFHMKSGNSFKTRYFSKSAVSGKVFEEILKAANNPGIIWLTMNTEFSNAAISINISEVEAITLAAKED